MLFAPGTKIDAYEIVAAVDAGGMGDVYKATDTRLNRTIALKFLPLELTRDEKAKARFIQEAQAASAIDHPSICTIYDIGETGDGQIYLAMAYYAGGTLRDRLGDGPLPIDEAVEVVVQVALGLEKAHALGIVHRDIKAANLMFTEDGQPKIVDFGLVKLLGKGGLTEPGMTLGTVGYMCPEQLLGQDIDARADVWSLGVVLFEMVTGTLPFQRPQAVATVTAILEDTPPPMGELRSGVPPELDRIVARMLSKDPAFRYQSVSDLVAELRRFQRESEHVDPTSTSTRRIILAASAALLAGVAGVLWLGDRSDGVLRFTNPTQVTTAVGVEDHPAWSPDGQTLAYSASSRGEIYAGNWDIWLVQLGGASPVNRTEDHVGADRYPSWSPDGRQIAFWSDREGGGYFVMSALGGPARKLSAVSTGASTTPTPLRSRDRIMGARPEWSADGSELAVSGFTPELGSFVEIVSMSTARSRRVPLPGREGGRRFNLSWSPDGRFFAYVDATGVSSQVTRLWVLDLEDESGHPITDGLTGDWTAGWSSDGRSVFFVSSRGGTMDLWRQAIHRDGTPDGAPVQLTTAIGMRQATLSPDGTKLAFSRGRRIANLWRVPIVTGRRVGWADAEQLTFDEAFVEHVDVLQDRVILSSDRSGNPDLWMMPASGGELQQLTTTPTPDWAPAWSSDGERIAFYSFDSGNRDIWTMAVDGGALQQVTQSEATDWYPDWSPDGDEIVFWSERGGSAGIWTIPAEGPAEGGEPVRITGEGSEDIHPQWWASGEWLMFTSDRDGENRLWRVRVGGGDPEPLTKSPTRMGRLSADGREVFFLGWAEIAGEIWSLTLEDGAERKIADLTGRTGTLGANALAVDDAYLYFTWEEDLGDIWTMDVERD